MYNYHLAMYILSPWLLYSDSESGSGDTQSSSCRSSQLRAHAPSILHLHPVFFIPCPVTIVTIHSANSTIVHSGSIIQGVHVMTCLLFIKICIHAFFSLSSSLFVLSHRMVRKHNPSYKLMLTGTGSFLILHLRHYVRYGSNPEVGIGHQLIMPYIQALPLTT